MYEGKIPEFLEELKEFYYKNKHIIYQEVQSHLIILIQ